MTTPEGAAPQPQQQDLNPNQSMVTAADPLAEALKLTPEDLKMTEARQAAKIMTTILDADERSQIYDYKGKPVTEGVTRTVLFRSGQDKRGVDEVVAGTRKTYHFFDPGSEDGLFISVNPTMNQIRVGGDYVPTGVEPRTEPAGPKSFKVLTNDLPAMFLDARASGNVHYGPQYRVSRTVRRALGAIGLGRKSS